MSSKSGDVKMDELARGGRRESMVACQGLLPGRAGVRTVARGIVVGEKDGWGLEKHIPAAVKCRSKW